MWIDLRRCLALGPRTRCSASLVALPLTCSAGTSSRGLVFVSDRVDQQGIYAINADGSDLRLLVERGDVPLESPQSSPDGSWLAYTHSFGTLMGAKADGSQPRDTGIATIAFEFAWAPDGKQVAVAAESITLVSAGGAAEVPIAGTDGGRHPTWSPDGRWIAYEHDGEL